jgi:hypothetical protein
MDNNATAVTPTNRRHEDLRKRFNDLSAKRFDGMRLSFEDIVVRVAHEFYYSPKTVERIVTR